MTALPNKHYIGHRRATEIDGNQRTHGKGRFGEKLALQVSSTAAVGRRWRRQHKTELD